MEQEPLTTEQVEQPPDTAPATNDMPSLVVWTQTTMLDNDPASANVMRGID